MTTGAAHTGGGFNPPDPTDRGGPDYGRFIEAVRTLQDHSRAADAPDAVITEAADLIEKVSALLAPYEADEWHSPSGRRMDLPNRGNILSVPVDLYVTEDGRIGGTAHFRRYHVGRNSAVHGGVLGLLFDSLLGFTATTLTKSLYQRTAHLVSTIARSCRSVRNCRWTPVSTGSKGARSSSAAGCSTTVTC